MKNIKKTATFLVMAMTFLISSCEKDPKIIDEEEFLTIKIANQDELITALPKATAAYSNPNIKGVALDMNEMRRLTLGHDGSALIETLITELTTAAKKQDKGLAIDLPEISIDGNVVRIPYYFYDATRGGARNNTKSGGIKTKSGSNNSYIVIENGGRLHFVGGVPTSANLNIDQNIMTKRGITTASGGNGDDDDDQYPITADRIDIDNDGMTDDCWDVFEIVKADTVGVVPLGHNLYHSGLGRNVIGKTRSDRETVATTGRFVQFHEVGDAEMMQVNWPVRGFPNKPGRPDAKLRFLEEPAIVGNGRSDTIRMGGTWINNVYTPFADSWALEYTEAHFRWFPANHRYHFNPKTSGANIVIKVPEYVEGLSNDSAFYQEDAIRYAWVSLEELVEFVGGRAINPQNPQRIVFSGPAAVKVPAEWYGDIMTLIPPSELHTGMFGSGEHVSSYGAWFDWAGLQTRRPGGIIDLQYIPTIDLPVKTR